MKKYITFCMLSLASLSASDANIKLIATMEKYVEAEKSNDNDQFLNVHSQLNALEDAVQPAILPTLLYLRGIMHARGQGVRKNYHAALKDLHRAANQQDDPDIAQKACTVLPELIFLDEAEPYSKALRLFEEIGDHKDPYHIIMHKMMADIQRIRAT